MWTRVPNSRKKVPDTNAQCCHWQPNKLSKRNFFAYQRDDTPEMTDNAFNQREIKAVVKI